MSVATVVSSGSSSSVTPSGTATSASVIVSLISIPDTSWVIDSGIAFGSASMFSSRVICSSTPPSLTPGASSPPVSSSGTTAWIATLRSTRSRSTCIVSPRTGWYWALLRIAGVAWSPSVTSSTAPLAASAWRSSRASTLKVSGSPPPP